MEYLHFAYFPIIVPETSRYCDLAHIVDPAHRSEVPEDYNPRIKLTDQETSLAFAVITLPSNKGYIVHPDDYELKIEVTAENSRRPLEETVSIHLDGKWYADETRILRDGVRVSIGSN